MTHRSSAASQPVNRLALATSPYLLQHAHNPVDWYEWGPDALQRAKAENKPIFLSIGYAACHWCHVMAHESFENAAIAATMNKHFINIKVDREERPDLDEIYMQATMLMNNGQGGWPMSVWLTPDLKPFFAGTYFPPEPRYGRPGFPQICERIAEVWKSDDHGQLLAQAEEVTKAIRQSLAPSAAGPADLSLTLVDRVAAQLARVFDETHGGLSGGGTNKFPPTMAIDVMLRSAHRMPADNAARQQIEARVRTTLDKMAAGGIYDHLAGGIARYSTDVEWHVPHFEKMLYDQALVSRCYIDASQYFREPAYRAVAEDIFTYVLADLQSPAGGFYSTRDADSEGEEGKYYVWRHDEIMDLLGDEIGPAFCAFYDVHPSGNWRDPHDPEAPKNVLRILQPAAEVAAELKISEVELQRRLAQGRQKLLAAREKRVAPGLDDKILAEWNGLMIAALARGGAVFDAPRYVTAAARAADFILKDQSANGRLLRASRDGRKLETAFLTDYAAMIDGLLELYEATFDPRWLSEALRFNGVCTELFWDAEAGGYFFTAADHEPLITRSKDLRDAAVPSGNSVQLMNLLRLHLMTGDAQLADMAQRVIRCFSTDIAEQPFSAERFLAGLDFAYGATLELAFVGDPTAPVTQSLLGAARAAYLPNRVLMLRDTRPGSAALKSPLLEGRALVNGGPAAYVCQNYVCQQPVQTADELRKLLR